MDNFGNVVSPIENHILQTDNDWGKATDTTGNKIPPEIEKAEYQTEYVQTSTAWIKKVVITFKHDLKVDTPGNYAGLFSNEVLIKTGTLNVIPDAFYNSNGFVDGYKQSGNQVSIKVEDNPPPPNGKLTYDDVNNGNISVEYTRTTRNRYYF